jgi:hypothetical protein
MALTITHSFISSKPDGTDSSLVKPSNWNANHTITGTLNETGLAFTDVTTNDTSTTKHGLAPKLPNDSTLFLNGSGAWSSPLPSIKRGMGTPEGLVIGSAGDFYQRTDGGANTTLYVKESGIGTNIGWVAK